MGLFGLKGKLIWWAILGVVGIIIGLLLGLKLSVIGGVFGEANWFGYLIAAGGLAALFYCFKKKK